MFSGMGEAVIRKAAMTDYTTIGWDPNKSDPRLCFRA
jgi:hypothetical protein